jgi:lysophospholipase L1-like esterase
MSRDTSISAPRKRLFSIIMLLLPVILLLLLEGSIRLMGVAEDYPLFISAEGLPGYRQPNPAVISRYFGTPSAAPEISPDTHYFLAQKPEDSFRIFVMGGSSAAGFPYGRFGSISGMLQEKEIEIISVAMSAINSYAIRDFSEEVLAAQPDLVLIYAGHNEYLGIMGTGAVFSSFAGMHQLKLVYLALLDSHLFRLLQQVIIPLTSGEAPEVQRGTLMAKVAEGQRIPLADNQFEAGVAQFQDNIGTVLQLFKENDVPVMLGTLVSNEKDLAPFVPGDESPNADVCYQKGQTLAAQGQFGRALEQFQLARDLDLLRFRAPGIFNQTLRSLAAEYDAILVDVESSFRRSAEHGLIGNQLLLEHVHPNRYGYFLMTEAYVEALIASGLLGESTPYPSTASWQEIPLTDVDLLVAEKKIKNITTQFPFTDAFQYRSELPERQSETRWHRLAGGSAGIA